MKTRQDGSTNQAFNSRTQRARTWVCWTQLQFLRFLYSLLFISFFSVPSLSFAFEPVRAGIGKEAAWTGEAVPLIITLYSLGPFSGTAVFDLPELPQTAFVKAGNPLVGSEEVDKTTYMTQRHEYTLYTQRSGDIVVPPFRVRFSGKRTFTSAPEPMQGTTPELRFESKRPPGTESMGVVICATAMKIQQTWDPETADKIQAGDVIVRTITRNAVGTTAMTLPPVSADAPEGVRVYSGTVGVEDKVDRGDSKAERVETAKYQFQRAGSFTLPDLIFVWWDPDREKAEREALPGRVINVVEANVSASSPVAANVDAPSIWTGVLIVLPVFTLLTWVLHRPVRNWIAVWRAYYNRPQARAVRRLRSACASNDAPAAYGALTEWLTACRSSAGGKRLDSFLDMEQQRSLREHWQTLSRHLFAPGSATTAWDGSPLWAAFPQMRRRLTRTSQVSQSSALPALNPTTVTSE